jgi:histidine triad (HIT) family protein
MHVMPVKAGIELLPPQTRKEDPAVLAEHAARLIAAIGGDRA